MALTYNSRQKNYVKETFKESNNKNLAKTLNFLG